MSKGFATDTSAPEGKRILDSSNKHKGRLISWSPWPPADFQTRYPAFPFVLTILMVVVLKWYISLLR